jgi:hypothetical protein
MRVSVPVYPNRLVIDSPRYSHPPLPLVPLSTTPKVVTAMRNWASKARLAASTSWTFSPLARSSYPAGAAHV